MTEFIVSNSAQGRALDEAGKTVQLSKWRTVLYHLYPGVGITIAFVLLAPVAVSYGFPPQLGVLLSIALVALPVLFLHLSRAKREENKTVFGNFTNKLPTAKLIGYSLALVVFAFLIWGVTAPLNKIIAGKLLFWLPHWYTVQDLAGYDMDKIFPTLVANLLLNGFIAPYAEELYFRGYLLPRMKSWGRHTVVANTVLFSLYHFWQPYLYVTLIVALLPMVWLVWKTGDLRVGILAHCLLNLVGSLLSFAAVS